MNAERAPLWTNVYGLGRSILGLGTLSTLVFNDATVLFSPSGKSVAEAGAATETFAWTLFALLDGHLALARWIAIASLVLVISGWRPRITGVLHWWICFSFANACVPLDGGDQVAAVLSLLLVPITLLDSRRSHWDPPLETSDLRGEIRDELGRAAMWLIRFQVAVIYFHAGIGKFPVTEWSNGTVLYYWVIDPLIGVPSWATAAATAVLSNPWVVTLASWSVLMLEIMLFLGLVADRKWHKPLLWAGLVFHAGIIVLFGLVSFFCSMAAALVLFLRPWDQPIAITSPRVSLARWFRTASASPVAGDLSPSTK